MLRWCMDLLMKLGPGRYRFVSKVCNTPSPSILKSFEGHDRGRIDGVTFETINTFQQQMSNYYEKMEIQLKIDESWRSPFSWQRCGTLGYDSRKIKAGIVHNPHTMNVIGFADKWQNSPDAILAALDSAVSGEGDEKKNTDENNNLTNNNANEKEKKPELELADHYFVFYFTTWEYKKPFKFIAGRCAVKNLDHTYLRFQIMDIISALAMAGFVVTAVGGDGASEN